MRILMIQPNYHSGGAEIAGNWPPSWVPYVGGALKQAGFDDIRFIDAMTNYIEDEALAVLIQQHQPDIVMATAITPMIYKSQDTLRIAKSVCPDAIAIMGGIHPTYMYREVLQEAPWVDYIIRGEGEEISVNLVRAIAEGRDSQDRESILGLAYLDDAGQVVVTPAHPPIRDLNTLSPDWTLLDWDRYIYTPLNVRVAVPNFARGCPFRCRFCCQWKFWRKYRARKPKLFVDEIEHLVKEHNIGFFILADEEPTISKARFVSLCEELIDRNLGVHWGINTRVTDILRDEAELPLYRKAGLVHVSLGTEAAAQLNLDVFRKETTIADNKRAVKLLRDNGIVAEVQFIMGLSNETPETIEETYRMARDWKSDMTNWNMFTPWPFAELFQDLEDKVEVRDFSHYNFVTPIIKPDNMTREAVLKGVLRNYARFYGWKFLEYWFTRDPFKRRYLLGCLWAFVQTTLNQRFYNLKRVKRKGMHAEIELGFDQSRILSAEDMIRLKAAKLADVEFASDVSACGAPAAEVSESANGAIDDVQVVIVDGDEAARIALRKGLRSQAGIEIASEATNGETGLILLDSIVVDVVIVSEPLPDMSLSEFMQRVQQQNSCQSFRLLILTDDPTSLPDIDSVKVAHSPHGSSMEHLAQIIHTCQFDEIVLNPQVSTVPSAKSSSVASSP
ncbi:magnesium-protoporphyrin IX monomethyl ester anaerobic oxidative cyclase [Leptolyngbya sp. Heron Island J]|uniref:magnesium-protoporphyrin IX monomethyl ester anaerobic oxidative cyclase n=1 Tax=Leptolyngbya sp. Heron Island J TaxID=1385935 RepID=UPI00042A4B26|nr:magnesium-protoporphyrin IX monomethyl ester anaerobic oxidative cyclase [Leptolyngbya sp. Heron Island J]